MSKIKSLLIGLLLLAFLIAISYGVLSAGLGWVQSLNPTLAGALTTATVGLVGLWYVQWQSKSRDIAESHRPSKIKIYNTFFGIVEKFQANEKSSISKDELADWMQNEFAKLNRGLVLWASPEVICAWLDFRTSAESGKNLLLSVDRMYQAIRKDLGNSNFGLQSGDLMKINLKDPNEWTSSS